MRGLREGKGALPTTVSTHAARSPDPSLLATATHHYSTLGHPSLQQDRGGCLTAFGDSSIRESPLI